MDRLCAPVMSIKNKAVETDVDVYVWDKAPHSVGHVMATDHSPSHNSTAVILSQFPFTERQGGEQSTFTFHPGKGFNRKVSVANTFGYEKRNPNHRYQVAVPDAWRFYNVAAEQRAATYWDWWPTGADETQCSTAVFLSLQAGNVPFPSNAHYSMYLRPDEFDQWMMEDARESSRTGVKMVDPASGK